MSTHTPLSNEYAPYYQSVLDLVDLENISQTLKTVHVETQELIESLSEEQGEMRYAHGKWSIKEIIQHIIDCERVFVYRALRISRGDKTEMPGFDQELWALNSNADAKSLNELALDALMVRNATVSFFEGLTDSELTLLGVASGRTISVRSIGFIIAGHERHHIQVIKKLYL